MNSKDSRPGTAGGLKRTNTTLPGRKMSTVGKGDDKTKTAANSKASETARARAGSSKLTKG